MRLLLISTTLAIACEVAVCQQGVPTLSSQDLKAASYEYQNYISARLVQRHETLANSAPYFADGSRGYEVAPSFEIGTLPVKGERVQDSAVLLGAEACRAQAVVIGQLQSSTVYPISGDRGLVTAYAFWVVDSLQGNVTAGSTVTAVEFGGELQNGTTLERVAIRNVVPFKAGQQYLLFLNKASGYTSAAFFLGSYDRVRFNNRELVASGRPSDEIITNPVSSGETLASFRSKLSAAKAKFMQTHEQTTSCQ